MLDYGWSHVRQFGISLIPEPIVDELRELEEQILPDSKPKPATKKSDSTYSVQTGKLENEDEYREYIEKLDLKYITAAEVIRPHRNIRDGVKNQLPPKRYWYRIKKTLQVADTLRGELGVPLKMINSAYRCPDYNSACSGAVANSYHTKNMALDLVFACPPKEAAKAAKKLRSNGKFRGGIGVYSSFIHIDTRGRNADWGMSV